MDELSNRRKQGGAGQGRAASLLPPRLRTSSSDDKRSRKQLLDEIADLRRRLNAKDALDPLRKAP